MRRFPRVLVIASAAAVLASGVARPEAQQASPPPAGDTATGSTTAGKVAHPPEAFGGTWDYNPRESVNAANGRPEQAPQSATQRRNPGAAAGTGTNTRSPGQGGYGGGGSGGGSVYGPGGGYGPGGYGGGAMGPSAPIPRAPMLNTFVLRDLVRDLLEIPEMLKITVTAESVTFVDDIDRELTFPTDGKKNKYQLAAAVFHAKTSWVNHQLQKQITAAEDFKMFITYMLSDDAQKLFVIIRLGEPRKDRPVVGVNRVYDRVSR